jgi:acyl-coenzyme A thioesterase PaaI-like protein
MAEQTNQAAESDAMVDVASAVRRLSEALITRQLDADTAKATANALVNIAERVEHEPARSKAENFGLRNRIASFVETGAWPDPPPNGSQLEFDVASPIGGIMNPASVGAQYFRNDDEVIGRVTVGRCFEGPPERVHGGIICAIFDEVMGSVFRVNGTASAFTGELSVRFEAPCPIGVDLEFRARQVGESGRKRFLEGEAHSPDGRFASATATFIEMRMDHFTDIAE